MNKRIVCFGDSNTWGYNGKDGSRFDEDTRWTGILASLLGKEYTVIEEGQNGRTIMCDDPWEGYKKGMDYILPCVESQSPFDLLIIMLGTNDLKVKFSLPAHDIAGGLGNMVRQIRSFTGFDKTHKPQILIMSPAPVRETVKNASFAESFLSDSLIERSEKLAKEYKAVAERYECEFFDAGSVAVTGDWDGIHITEESHRKLAEALSEKIKAMKL